MKKNLVTIILIISIISSAVYSPLLFQPKQADAWVFSLVSKVAGKVLGQPVIDIKALAKALKDAVAMRLAQRMIDDMVKSSIAWANTGFEGNPAFVSDFGSHLGGIANQEAGRFLNNVAGSNLCSPFKPQIVLSLRDYYQTRLGVTDDYSCTLTDIQGNFQAFLDGDFSQGGWDSWFQLTQNSNNNPYEVYLTAQGELDGKIAAKVNTELRKLDWAQGFKTKGGCLEYNSYIPSTGDPVLDPVTGLYTIPIGPGELKDSTKGQDECILFAPDVTPGSTIKSQLDRILPSGLEKLITVEHVEQLVGAFANGLLNRYVFGEKGLFSEDYDDHYNASSDGPVIPDQDICDGIICDPPATSTPPGTPGGQNGGNSGNSAIEQSSSCTSNQLSVFVNQPVFFALTLADGSGPLPNDNTYIYTYTWMWGTTPAGALGGENEAPSKTSSSPIDNTSMAFPAEGDYYAAMRVDVLDGPGSLVASFTKICNVSNYGTSRESILPVSVFDNTQAN